MPLRRDDDDRPRAAGLRKALVVEDDAAISNLLKIVLEQNAWIVETAKDYNAATTAIESGSYELFLLDIGLPDGNGLDLVRWIRDDLTLSTPIVMLSAYGQDSNVQKAFSFGANDFLPKPFRPKELIARLERVVE